MDAKALAAIINAAINEILKTGSSPDTKKRLKDGLAQALDEAAAQPTDAIDYLQRHYKKYLDSVIRYRGLPVCSIVSSDGTQSDRSIEGIGMEGKFELFEPKIYCIFEECIKDVESQAKSFRQQIILSALNTFDEWAQSIPKGGTKDKSFREDAGYVRQELKSVQKWENFYFSLKGQNFSNRISRLVDEANAIAAIWHCSEYCGDDCNHSRYNGKTYIIRGNFASKEGFIAEEKVKYTDELPIPRNDGCNCHYEYIYRLKKLQTTLLSPKGKEQKNKIIKQRKEFNDLFDVNVVVTTSKKNNSKTVMEFNVVEKKPEKKKSSFFGGLFSKIFK